MGNLDISPTGADARYFTRPEVVLYYQRRELTPGSDKDKIEVTGVTVAGVKLNITLLLDERFGAEDIDRVLDYYPEFLQQASCPVEPALYVDSILDALLLRRAILFRDKRAIYAEYWRNGRFESIMSWIIGVMPYFLAAVLSHKQRN
jgi:hypothetical protein